MFKNSSHLVTKTYFSQPAPPPKKRTCRLSTNQQPKTHIAVNDTKIKYKVRGIK